MKRPPSKVAEAGRAELVKAGMLPRLLSAKIDRFVLSAEPEAMERMIEEGAKAIHSSDSTPETVPWWASTPEWVRNVYRRRARAILQSAGLTLTNAKGERK